MNNIKLIRNEGDHSRALARLTELMLAEPSDGSTEAEELEVLAVLIEHYEVRHFPIDMPDPVAAIKFRMDQQGLKAKDLVPYIGSASKVSEVLNGQRTLSLNMIRRLNAELGIPAEILIRDPVQKIALGASIDLQSFPLSEMRKRGYFPDFKGSLAELKEYAEEWITKFLNSVQGGHSLQPTMLRSNAHLRSSAKPTDAYSLWAWQVRVLQKVKDSAISAPYKPGSINEKQMTAVAQLSWSEQGPLLAKELLKQHGIHLVIEPHLPKTYMDGAVCLCPAGNPVIALTLRFDRLDNFWFSLMHELAHIALHIDGSESWFIDDLEARSDDQQEIEADALAERALIPIDKSELRSITTAEGVRSLAKSLSISPCIIAGRLRYEQKDHKLFGSALRNKVRHFFPEHKRT